MNVGVTDKAAGDAIKAADIDALRIAQINKTGESSGREVSPLFLYDLSKTKGGNHEINRSYRNR